MGLDEGWQGFGLALSRKLRDQLLTHRIRQGKCCSIKSCYVNIAESCRLILFVRKLDHRFQKVIFVSRFETETEYLIRYKHRGIPVSGRGDRRCSRRAIHTNVAWGIISWHARCHDIVVELLCHHLSPGTIGAARSQSRRRVRSSSWYLPKAPVPYANTRFAGGVGFISVEISTKASAIIEGNLSTEETGP